MMTTELARGEAPLLGADSPRATGDWQGARSALERRGLQLSLDYLAETFARWGTGDVSPPVSYWGSVDAALLVDSFRLGLWPGGTLLVRGQQGHGRGASRGLELQMPASSLEASPFVQLGELWYEQHLVDDRLRIVVGKQDANTDFLAPRFPDDFLNGSFGMPPNVPLPSYPAQALGALVSADLIPWLSLRAGAYDGRARAGALGLDTAFDRDGLLVAAAAVVRHSLGQTRRDTGVFSVGAWRHAVDVVVGERVFEQNYGAFVLADVMLPIAAATAVQFFARAAWVPADRNPADLYAGGGVTLQGVRGNDAVGVGVGHLQGLGAGEPASGDETFLELFYRVRWVPWLSVAPDVQLSSTQEHRVWLVGTRLSLKL